MASSSAASRVGSWKASSRGAARHPDHRLVPRAGQQHAIGVEDVMRLRALGVPARPAKRRASQPARRAPGRRPRPGRPRRVPAPGRRIPSPRSRARRRRGHPAPRRLRFRNQSATSSAGTSAAEALGAQPLAPEERSSPARRRPRAKPRSAARAASRSRVTKTGSAAARRDRHGAGRIAAQHRIHPGRPRGIAHARTGTVRSSAASSSSQAGAPPPGAAPGPAPSSTRGAATAPQRGSAPITRPIPPAPPRRC